MERRPALPSRDHRFIPGFPRYCAGRDGTILSCNNNRWGIGPWRPIRPGRNNKQGRCVVAIRRSDGNIHSVHVHRLVLSAFVGPCPRGMEACHNNGDASDNRLANLRWATKADNGLDTRRHGRKKGERHHLATLTDDLVREVRRRAARGDTHQSIADALGVQRRNVGKVVDRSRWSHVA